MRRRFTRKQVPDRLRPAHQVFLEQAERLGQARRALLSCLPVGRVDPAPVGVGLDLLDDELTALRAALPGWRCPEIEDEWQACLAALEESQGAIAPARAVAQRSAELRLRRGEGPAGGRTAPAEGRSSWGGLRLRRGELTELRGAVEDVDEPLGHAWQRAERAWRALRR